MSVSISKKIPVFMAQRFIKLSKLSRDTGISRSTLSKIYYSKSEMISFDVLDKLCKYFDCEISDILELKKD